MTEIIVHVPDKTLLRECLRTHDLFEHDQTIVIDDNFRTPNDDGSIHCCVLRNRRIPKFLFEEFKNRKVEFISINNDTGSVSLVLY